MNSPRSGCIAVRRNLNELMRVIGIETQDTTKIEVISDRFEEIGENGLFVALQGERVDGRKFCSEVIKKGGYVLSDQPGERTFVHEQPRSVYPLLLQAFYDYPSLKCTMIGVTGTNGKSTVSTLLYDMLESMGKKCCLIGTGRILFHRQRLEIDNTTPDSLTLVRIIDRAIQEKIDVVVMEVSSQALALHRVEGLMFDVALLTNLRQDHLDFHVTPQNYYEAKFQLFERIKERGTAILNSDEPNANNWPGRIHRPVFTYGEQSGNFRIDEINLQEESASFLLNDHFVESSLPGRFNVWNAAAVLAVGFALDLDWQKMIEFIRQAPLVEGRMQIIYHNPQLIVVDYAHTASAMEAMLQHWSFQAKKRGRKLWVVFGCGGQREKQKRPLMGSLACHYADEVILCNDNPRSENPLHILQDIVLGCDGKEKIIPDRLQAIKFAMKRAVCNDIIVVAGKGEETFQIQNNTKTCFSDRELICSLMKQQGG